MLDEEFVLTVLTVHDEAAEVRSFELGLQGLDALPTWEPGAHVDLVLGPGLVRQYSLCGHPEDELRWKVAVLREPAGRGGSQWIHDHLTVGRTVRARGPRNNFALVPESELLFIAGGIGVTPILPMIAQAESRGATWRLAYGGRSRSSMAFIAELEVYGDRVDLWPQDERGLIDLTTVLGEPRAGVKVYCCGPPALLQAVESACQSWPPGSLHVERFEPKEFLAHEPDAEFEVEFRASGVFGRVAPGRTILEVAEELGVHISTSCAEGICGSCETKVLEGIPEHRDSYLSDEERDSNTLITPCCSRSRSPCLVLDI